ncbi:hypothetical protein [Hypericibacter terrae]|jgi:hypothetical protein|nr:hypothetical protein [Hypericibacter terrae]
MRRFTGPALALILFAGLLLGGLSACNTGSHHDNGGWNPTSEPHSRGSHA